MGRQTDLNRLTASTQKPLHYRGPFAITSCSSAVEWDREIIEQRKVLHVGRRWT